MATAEYVNTEFSSMFILGLTRSLLSSR